MRDAAYEPLIQAAFERLCAAKTDIDRRLAGFLFHRLVERRNAARTAQEIARLERAKGLR